MLVACLALPCASIALNGMSGITTEPSGLYATHRSPAAELLVSGLEGGAGSTIGPDGALYVTETAAGRISRVDPRTGSKTTFASGLPKSVIGLGGVMDLVFKGRTAYALVTLVGPDVGGTDVVGIYRVDGPNRFTVVADIGQFAISNPPTTPFDVPSGLQYAIDAVPGGFVVTDGHHNRVLRVSLDGRITVLAQFDNIVPTGLAVLGNRVFVAQAGPLPHLPDVGKVVLLGRKPHQAIEVASGVRLAVDVEFGQDHRLYALSQGEWPAGGPPASPALPNTGSLFRVNWDGTVTAVATELNQPTSVEFIRDTAYVVSLAGEIWKIDLDRRHHW
jgi:sugar lactone lactonase YvrE